MLVLALPWLNHDAIVMRFETTGQGSIHHQRDKNHKNASWISEQNYLSPSTCFTVEKNRRKMNGFCEKLNW